MSSTLLGNLLVNSTYLPTTLLTLASLFNWPPLATVADGDSFDFIVVGSGAGAVVANRLSENDTVKVLLVEAGGAPTVESMLPGLSLLQTSNEDWNYQTVNDSFTIYQETGTYQLSAGKTLGGSSSNSYFIYQQADPQDYNNIADFLQDDSWSYDNVLTYIKKSESMQDYDVLKQFSEFHGTDGPIIITREPDESTSNILAAFEEVGIPTVLDLNTNYTVGYAQAPFTIGGGLRQSTAQAYLNNVTRSNLYVLTETVVEKIVFENKTAKGVVLKRADGEKINVYADKEVILSAGAYNSPKLLLLSGIGPTEDLEELGIDVIQDLPVGKNLQDHPGVFIVNKLDQSSEIQELLNLTRMPAQVLIGRVNLNDSKTYPDYQVTAYMAASDTSNPELLCSKYYGYSAEICAKFSVDTDDSNELVILLSLLYPKSTGAVQLRSTDPDDTLIVNLSFYSDEQDLTNIKKYLAHFFEVYNSTYFQSTGAEVADPLLGECGDLSFDNEDYWDCYIKNLTVPQLHATGTCAMGSVTDSNMLVIGVNNLRVVDASVMPNVTSGNTFAATVMMAEKISDVIKEKYGLIETTTDTVDSVVAEEVSDSESILDLIINLLT